MTVSILEIRGSRNGTDATDRSSSAELVWSVWGSDDLATCKAALVSSVPDTYDGLIYKSLTWEHLGNGTWEFHASYVHPDKADRDNTLDVGDYSFSFDTGGGTVNRKYSIATTSYAKSGETAADFKGAIGVVQDGFAQQVEGVDVGIPALKFSVRKRFANADLTTGYVNTLHALTYTTNNATFMGFAAGELLFVGASGQQGTDSDPEVTFNFIASPNVTGLSVGDITSIAKKGHEYLWVFFESIEDATAKATVKRPKSVHVEQVYGSSNFSSLGIV